MKLLFEIVVDQTNVTSKLEELRARVKALNKELKKDTNTPDQIEAYTQELVEAKTEIIKLTDAQKQLNRQFKEAAVPKDSLAGLRLQYQQIAAQIANLGEAERKSKFGQTLIAKGRAVKEQVDQIEQSIGRFTGQVGNYQKAVIGLGDLVTGGLLTGGIFALLQGIQAVGSRAIDINAKVSDSIADVAKAADLSIPRVEKLAERLEGRKTRTSLLDQLDIAEIGGKLGVLEKDLFGFTQSIDVVNVALGDQFGGSVEQTTDVIGKLRNVLRDIKTDEIDKDILHIGNALNYLEAQGAASAGTIAEFTGRIAGIGQSLGVSSAKIIGVSATLDELGVNAERGASGFVRILQRVAESPEKFAKAAGVSVDEFKKLVNEDIFGAVTLFLDKLNDKKLSNTELAKVLDQLKLDGVGTAEVVSKLGGSMDLLKKRVQQAGDALTNTNSISQEFEKRNQTLGAAVERLKNSFDNLLTGEGIGSGLKNIIGLFADFIDSLNAASAKLFDWKAASTGAKVANDILSDSLINARVEIEKETVATEKNFNILRNEKASRDQRNDAINELMKIYPGLINQQQLEGAGILELNSLQLQLTTTLRQQVAERAKLRAKEAIEEEILQKRLRQVQLEATPDRALLGELTAGETVRNFGTINPKKLRTNLKQQFDQDISELEASLRKVDAQFARLQTNAEDGLSAAEQDQIDAMRQFSERGGEVAKSVDHLRENSDKARGAVSSLGDEHDKTGKKTRKHKDEIDFAADSVEAFRKKVEDARKALEKAPQSKLAEAVGVLKQAEEELKKVEDRIKRLKEGAKEITPGEALQQGIDAFGPDTPAPTSQFNDQNLAVVGFPDASAANDKRIQEEQFTADEIARINQALRDKKIGLTEDEVKAKEDAEKRKHAIEEQAVESGLATAQALADAIFQIQQQNIDKEAEAKTAALDAEYQKKIASAQGNATLTAKYEKELEQKKAAIQKEAAEKRKKAAVTEAIINTALAIVKALTGAPPPASYILAAATAIAGFAQVAVISNAKYARGGKVKGSGQQAPVEVVEMPGAAGIVHENEYVADKFQVMRNPRLFMALEADRIRHAKPFAAGGYVSGQPSAAKPGKVSTKLTKPLAAGGMPESDVEQPQEATGGLIAYFIPGKGMQVEYHANMTEIVRNEAVFTKMRKEKFYPGMPSAIDQGVEPAPAVKSTSRETNIVNDLVNKFTASSENSRSETNTTKRVNLVEQITRASVLQDFKGGGFTGPGIEHRDETGRRVAGVAHEGEYVAPTSQIMRLPHVFEFLESDRLKFRRGFAAGGFTSSNVIPQIAIPKGGSTNQQLSITSKAEFTDEQIKALADGLAETMAKQVADQVYNAVALGGEEANRQKERNDILINQRDI